MINLEALICFLVFILVLGAVTSGIGNHLHLMNSASDAFDAKTNSEKCAVIVDSLYSNSSGKLNEKFDCFISENGISSNKGDWEKSSKTISNSEVQIEADYSLIEVRANDHYR